MSRGSEWFMREFRILVRFVFHNFHIYHNLISKCALLLKTTNLMCSKLLSMKNPSLYSFDPNLFKRCVLCYRRSHKDLLVITETEKCLWHLEQPTSFTRYNKSWENLLKNLVNLSKKRQKALPTWMWNCIFPALTGIFCCVGGGAIYFKRGGIPLSSSSRFTIIIIIMVMMSYINQFI